MKFGFPVLIWLIALGFMGCQSKNADQKADVAKEAIPSAPKEINDAKAEAKPAEEAPAFHHDPSNPPVDCPLRKAGLDPTKMKPFELTEQYIQFLERADRAEWQKPEAVVDALGLQGNEIVFDIGAGSGYFSFPMSKRLQNGGKVIAGDVEPEMVMHIHHKTMTENIQNIEAKVIDQAKPEVPAHANVLFMCDVLHHIANPVEWLTHVANQMDAGSSFYIIEFHEGDIPQGPPENAKIPKEKLIDYASKAGLAFDREIEGLLPYQHFLAFKKN